MPKNTVQKSYHRIFLRKAINDLLSFEHAQLQLKHQACNLQLVIDEKLVDWLVDLILVSPTLHTTMDEYVFCSVLGQAIECRAEKVDYKYTNGIILVKYYKQSPVWIRRIWPYRQIDELEAYVGVLDGSIDLR